MKNMIIKYIVTKNDIEKYKNINAILSNKLNFSTRLLTKLIKKSCIYLNSSTCDTRTLPDIDDILTINFGYSEDNSNIVPSQMPLNIIYEDDWILAIDKPAGVATHPSILHYDNSLSNGIKNYFDSINLKKKIRPINRLDSNTSRINFIC